jgi:hypothetical protein
VHRSLVITLPVVATGVAVTGCTNHAATASRTSASAKPAAIIRHLTAKATGGSGVDNTPRGPSLGDMFFEHGTMTDSTGGKAGTYQLVTQLVAGTPQRGDEHESLTLHLADGDVLALEDIAARDSYTLAVIGGTRAYARTVGTLTAQASADDTENLTLTLER